MWFVRLRCWLFGECRVRGHDCREGICVRCGLGMEEGIRARLRQGDYFLLPALSCGKHSTREGEENCSVDPINVECRIYPWVIAEALHVWNEHGFFDILVEQGYQTHGYRMVDWDTDTYGSREPQMLRFCALGEAGLEKLRDLLTRLAQYNIRPALQQCRGKEISLTFETPKAKWVAEVLQGGEGRIEYNPISWRGEDVTSALRKTLWDWTEAETPQRKTGTCSVASMNAIEQPDAEPPSDVDEDPDDPSSLSAEGIPACPNCHSKDARCFCRDVGGVDYLDEYTFCCPACGYLKRESEYGGSWAENWTTRCPFCGETCHSHEATPLDLWFAPETG